MTRVELYERVWAEPLVKVAASLDVSDVGLAKVCGRYDVPRPARGYWAKVAAGKAVKRAPLPDRGRNPTIVLGSRKPRYPRPPRLHSSDSAIESMVATELRPTLANRHPLIRATSAHFVEAAADLARRQKEHGLRRLGGVRLAFIDYRPTTHRRSVQPTEGLRIFATLDNIDWILRFHEALIEGLSKLGCSFRTAKWKHSLRPEVVRDNEALGLSFYEEFSTHGEVQVGLDSYRLKVQGEFGSPRSWIGTREALGRQLPSIVAMVSALLTDQHGTRKIREAEASLRRRAAEKREEESRRWYAQQRLIFERKEARRAQVDRARALCKAHDDYLALTRFVNALEARAASDSTLSTWLTLVRPGLVDPLDEFVRVLHAEAAAPARPLWWPDDL